MNLHGIASGVIAAVNPMTAATFYASAGYGTDGAGRQIPKYAAPAAVTAQVQDLSQRDLMHLDGLNIQGSQKVIYLHGIAQAVVRPKQKGGDVIWFAPVAEMWLTTAVIEQWPDWCKVAATLQVDSEPPFFPSLRFNYAVNGQYVPLVSV